MKKITHKIIFFIFCFTLMDYITGCDKYQDLQISVLNNTSDTIKLHFSELSYFYLKDSIVICNPYIETILVDKVVYYAKNRPCYPDISDKTDLIITATTSSSKILKKDFKKNSSWYCVENSRVLRKLIFEINEEDLE